MELIKIAVRICTGKVDRLSAFFCLGPRIPWSDEGFVGGCERMSAGQEEQCTGTFRKKCGA